MIEGEDLSKMNLRDSTAGFSKQRVDFGSAFMDDRKGDVDPKLETPSGIHSSHRFGNSFRVEHLNNQDIPPKSNDLYHKTSQNIQP